MGSEESAEYESVSSSGVTGTHPLFLVLTLSAQHFAGILNLLDLSHEDTPVARLAARLAGDQIPDHPWLIATGHRIIPRIDELRNRDECMSRPFDIFWSNPTEPRHSKLIAYFIDPRAIHGRGEQLLRLFLDAIGLQDLPAGECEVHCEAGRIDLLIEHPAPPRFAVVVENKVNNACDQDGQLVRYHRLVKEQKGYDETEIYLRYMPLLPAQPTASSLGEHHDSNRFRVVTFEEQINGWLAAGVNALPNCELRVHLQCYHYLIQHLVHRRKKESMIEEILKLLAEADSRGEVPPWPQFQSLQSYANQLVQGYSLFTRHKLLRRVGTELTEKHAIPCDRIFWKSSENRDVKNDQLSVTTHQWEGISVGVSDFLAVALYIQAPFNPVELGLRRIGTAKTSTFQEFLQDRYPHLAAKSSDWWYHLEFPGNDFKQYIDSDFGCAARMAELVLETRKAVQEFAEMRAADADRR